MVLFCYLSVNSPVCETNMAGVQARDTPLEPVWVESPLKLEYDIHRDTGKLLCYPTHCCVGDRDIHVVTGTLKLDTKTAIEEYLGMEFAGYNDREERVIGIVSYHVSTPLYITSC